VDAGYNTVESVAYTYVSHDLRAAIAVCCVAELLCYISFPLIPICLTCFLIPRPKRLLEQIKGISEQKATKILVEGTLSSVVDFIYC
jgi:hypothetical protein